MLSTVLSESPAARSARLLLTGVLCLSAPWVVGSARAQAKPAPEGAEFRVNTFTTNHQYYSAVASDASGNFVVVWDSYGQDGSGYGVFGQRFSARGAPRGAEFHVNTYTTLAQRLPAIASDAIGNFVVVWESYGQDGSSYGVFGQRFDATGAPQGSEFRLNAYTPGQQARPAVTYEPNGSFVVVWDGYSQDGDRFGIFGRRFNASGTPLGSEFQVNSYTTNSQNRPAVAADPNGGFVVAWSSYRQDGEGGAIVASRYDAAGTPQGGEFQVNTYTTNIQDFPVVASDANGNFVVVWKSLAQDGSSWGVFGQAFNAAGARSGSEFQVNTYTTDFQSEQQIAADENGNFVVVWDSLGQDGSLFGVYGRRLDVFGPQGSEFRVNSYTTDYQSLPAIATSPDGDFIVVWESDGQDGSSGGIFGQRYGDIIFEDGFESGDLTRWSSASTGGGDVSVTGGAALANTAHGMQAVVNDTAGIYVQDDSPSAEIHYRARLYFDTNGFDPGEAQSHFRTRIFIAFDGLSQRQITIVLKRQSGQYSVEGRARLNDGTRADTGFITVPAGENFVEVAWNRASRNGISDGDFSLNVDGDAETAITLTGLDTSLGNVEFARMGAMSVKTGAAGTLFFDQFESRRTTPIGPECCQQF
jgi:hypothetical protein